MRRLTFGHEKSAHPKMNAYEILLMYIKSIIDELLKFPFITNSKFFSFFLIQLNHLLTNFFSFFICLGFIP